MFIILHEYGHYLDYKKFNNKLEYAMWIYNVKQPFREINNKICELNKLGVLTQDYYNERYKVYRKCADEASADKYAIENIQQKIDELHQMLCD